MHSMDEQMCEIMKRAENVKEKRAIRKRLYVSAVMAAVCLILLVGAAVAIPLFANTARQSLNGRYGSLLLTAPQMRYVVIGVLAFVTGICFTVFCLNWREMNKKEQGRS